MRSVSTSDFQSMPVEGFIFYKQTNPNYQNTKSPVVAFVAGHTGYWPIDTRSTAQELNSPNVTDELLESAEMGSMFGWHTPGAKLALDFAHDSQKQAEGNCHVS